jgi:primosomal protein N' (replication factor Y)
VAAEVLPVARVLVDVSLAHLDRPYDYLVTESDSTAARPGARVRVRFAGRLVNGYIVDRLDVSEHPGRLGFVERVVSAEPVLFAEVADLARAVADRYAGSLADVLRLAVPPRHAKAENELADDSVGALADGVGAGPLPASVLTAVSTPAGPSAPGGMTSVSPGSPDEAPGEPPGSADERRKASPSAAVNGGGPVSGWSRYPAGGAFLSAVRARRPARAVWQALPGEDWPAGAPGRR